MNAQLANLSFESSLGYFEDFDLWRQVGDPSDPLFIDESIPMEGTHVNHPPTGTDPEPFQGSVGSLVNIPLNMSDPDVGDVISVVGFNFPSWLHHLDQNLRGIPDVEMELSLLQYNLSDGQASSGPYSFWMEIGPRPTQSPPMAPEDIGSQIAELERKSNFRWLWFLAVGVPVGIVGGIFTFWRYGKEIWHCCSSSDTTTEIKTGGEEIETSNPTFEQEGEGTELPEVVAEGTV